MVSRLELEVSFARRYEDECAVVVVPRHYYQLSNRLGVGMKEAGPPNIDWADTQIVIPEDFPQQWQCELSGRAVESYATADRHTLEVPRLLDVFPVAVLKSASV